VPVGLKFLVAGYTYSSGGLATDPTLPLDNAHLDIHAPFIAFARAFDAWGKSAKLDAVLAAACLSGTAESNGVPVSRDICGGLDPQLRLTVNVHGAPAMGLAEFRSYRQDLIGSTTPSGSSTSARTAGCSDRKSEFRKGSAR
jgi:hypothetical protein